MLSWTAAAVLALLSACGGNNDQAQSQLPGSAPTTLMSHQTQAPNLPSVEGYLVSATNTKIVLRAADGKQTFSVEEQDAPQLGIEHLRSHAGTNTVGFRVYYEQQGGMRFVRRAIEIPPPALE